MPAGLRKELIHRLGTNYPSLEQIFDSYSDAIHTLLRTKPNIKKSFDTNKNETFKNKDKNKPVVRNFNKEKVGSLQNFKTQNKTINSDFKPKNFKFDACKPSQSGESSKNKPFSNTPCKFCSVSGHSMRICSKFPDLDTRKKRCVELGLCTLCSSAKHSDENLCPAKLHGLDFNCGIAGCQSNQHITALCPNMDSKVTRPIETITSALCFNSNLDSKSYILPTLTIQFTRGKKSRYVRCLIDTGSMRSYIGPKVVRDLCDDVSKLHEIDYEIKILLVLS